MYCVYIFRPRYSNAAKPKGKKAYGLIAAIIIILALIASVSLFLRKLSTQIAVSDAVDIVTKTVNEAVNGVISRGNFTPDYFISLEKDTDGNVSAITSNMAHINELSTEVLSKVIDKTDNGALRVKIPLGNLSGINLLMGKGPEVPIDIIMLTSSKVDYKNDIKASGINQSKYQLLLEITIDVDVLVPWGTESAKSVTEVIVADTVIVGRVPNTYLNMEN